MLFIFPADNNNSILFKFKQQVTVQTGNSGIKDVEIMVPLKYLSNFWRKIKMSLINCEMILMLTWFKKTFLVPDIADQEATFTITDTKLYIPVVTLPTQDNAKTQIQLDLGFKRTINWNKYLSKIIE